MAIHQPFDLDRFLRAQAEAFETALAELKRGRKTSHWMWFVFPQIAGLGRSEMARRYEIGSLAEARAYLANPVLHERLVEATAAVTSHRETELDAILPPPDDMKFRSSMTLFARAAREPGLFLEALAVHCAGRPDPATIDILERQGSQQ